MSGREDHAWREIVENFGDRVDLGDGTVDLPTFEEHDVDEHEAEAQPDPDTWTVEGHFEPPTPPPLPRLGPARAAAWFGVLGVPSLAAVLGVLNLWTGFHLPAIVALLMVAAFIGGFGYLVAHMRKFDEDPWDDGARL